MNIQDSFPFNIDWFDLLAVQGTLKSLFQHHSSKASILKLHQFFSFLALTRWTFVSKVISLLFNILSRLVSTSLSTSDIIIYLNLLNEGTYKSLISLFPPYLLITF